MSNWRPTIVAHRGGAMGFGLVENSREAFAAARAAGFPSECDVWAAADGEPIVMHDQHLDRTTLASGRVTDFGSETLRQVLLRTESGSVTIPLLREVASDIFLVEIKPQAARDLVHRTIQTMVGRTWRLQSFDYANLVYARELAPALSVALLARDLAAVETAVARSTPVYMDHMLLDAAIAQRIRNAGLTCGVWTVNSQGDLDRISSLRPDVVISDVPRLIQEWLG